MCFVWKDDGAHRVEIADNDKRIAMTKLLEEIPPGEILLVDFMKPMGISGRQLAVDIDVSASRINDGAWQGPDRRRHATASGLFFGMEPRFWLNLQTEYDMRIAVRESKDKIAPRIRVFTATAR